MAFSASAKIRNINIQRYQSAAADSLYFHVASHLIAAPRDYNAGRCYRGARRGNNDKEKCAANMKQYATVKGNGSVKSYFPSEWVALTSRVQTIRSKWTEVSWKHSARPIIFFSEATRFKRRLFFYLIQSPQRGFFLACLGSPEKLASNHLCTLPPRAAYAQGVLWILRRQRAPWNYP